MATSRKHHQKKNQSKKQELDKRKTFAYRRKQGLARDQELTELAPYYRRIIALALDQMLFMFFFLVSFIFAVALFGESLNATAMAYLPVYVFGLVYFIPKIAKSGQTFGCRKMKIIVIKKDGSGLLDFKHSAIRWCVFYGVPTSITIVVSTIFGPNGLLIAAAVNIVAFCAVAIPIVKTENRQGLHDYFAHAIVVREVEFEK